MSCMRGRHAGPVLASGAGKTKTGGQTYVRDERARLASYLPASGRLQQD
jgi:hypothetical protein